VVIHHLDNEGEKRNYHANGMGGRLKVFEFKKNWGMGEDNSMPRGKVTEGARGCSYQALKQGRGSR